jgi:hypothetical protein
MEGLAVKDLGVGERVRERRCGEGEKAGGCALFALRDYGCRYLLSTTSSPWQ